MHWGFLQQQALLPGQQAFQEGEEEAPSSSQHRLLRQGRSQEQLQCRQLLILEKQEHHWASSGQASGLQLQLQPLRWACLEEGVEGLCLRMRKGLSQRLGLQVEQGLGLGRLLELQLLHLLLEELPKEEEEGQSLRLALPPAWALLVWAEEEGLSCCLHSQRGEGEVLSSSLPPSLSAEVTQRDVGEI